MTRRKAKALERERESIYVPPPPGTCENCGLDLTDESAHCPMTSSCVGECQCNEHLGDQP